MEGSTVNPDIKEIQSAIIASGIPGTEMPRHGADGRWGQEGRAALAALISAARPATHLAAQALSDGRATYRTAMELIGHEAIVREAYKDSKGIWTWGIGVTNASGHIVHPRYKDNPQSIEHCIRIFLWLLDTKYGPEVLKAFPGVLLSEAQFAAALSFHYNTGSINRAEWVKSWLVGRVAQARDQFMLWRSPPEIVPRREKERDLFFDGRWSSDGKATVYEVAKPSYTPRWSSARRVDISTALNAALKGDA